MFHQVFRLFWFVIVAHSISYAADWGKIDTNHLAWWVQDAQTGEVLSQHQPDKSMSPASTMKLVTAIAALETLGNQFTWQTELQSFNQPQDGILDGDLIWQGSGNPVLDQEDLIAIELELQQNGIQQINGQLILSDKAWQNSGTALGFEHDKDKAFTTAPDGHMLNYKVAWLSFDNTYPNKIRLAPPLAVPVSNQVNVTLQKQCTSLGRYLKANWQNEQLVLTGAIPKSCQDKEMFINILDSKNFAGNSFIGQWHELGGKGLAGFKVQTKDKAPYILASHSSKPLSAVLMDMNKHSNNVIARTVFLNLSIHEPYGASIEASEKVIREMLAKKGIDDEVLALENGSGLSRKERVSARLMGNLLFNSYHSDHQQALIDTLPVGGEKDATLEKRFVQTKGTYALKTGTLNNVRALAGYWFSDDDKQAPLVIVVMLNEEPYVGQVVDLDKGLTQLIHESLKN